MKHRIALIFGLLCIPACSVGPDYARPELDIPEAYSRARLREATDNIQDPSDITWWEYFSDDTLNTLMKNAVSQNLSIKASVERIQEARALTRETIFGLFPQPQAFTSYGKSRVAAARFPGIANRGIEAEIYSIGGEASWEIDLFGRVRRQIEVADSQEEALIYNSIDTLRMTEAEVARAYIELRGSQLLKSIAQKNVQKQRALLDLINKRYEVGDIGPIDRELAVALTKTTEASIPNLQVNIDAALNRLATLSGVHVSKLDKSLLKGKGIPQYNGPNAIGKPGDLLRTRPDIRAAEERAHAAVANVGIRMAELFPIVNFTGSFSNDARQVDDWFTSASEAYNYGPRISWSIFNLGTVYNRIKSARAGSRAALLEYQETVLSALEETENALSSLTNLLMRRDLLKDAYHASREAERISKLQYDAGTIAYFDLLEAQQQALTSESDYITANMQASLAFVTLYRVIGGGWIAEEAVPEELAEDIEERIAIVSDA